MPTFLESLSFQLLPTEGVNPLTYSSSQFSLTQGKELDFNPISEPLALLVYKDFAKIPPLENLLHEHEHEHEHKLHEFQKIEFCNHKSRAINALDKQQVWQLAWQLVFKSLEQTQGDWTTLNKTQHIEQFLETRMQQSLAFIDAELRKHINSFAIDNGYTSINNKYEQETANKFYSQNIVYQTMSGNKEHKYEHIMLPKKEKAQEKFKADLQASPEVLIILQYMTERKKYSEKPAVSIKNFNKAAESIRPLCQAEEAKKLYPLLVHELEWASPPKNELPFIAWVKSAYKSVEKFFTTKPATEVSTLFNKLYTHTFGENKPTAAEMVKAFNQVKLVTPNALGSSDFLDSFISQKLDALANEVKNSEKWSFLGFFKKQDENILQQKVAFLREINNLNKNGKLNLYSLKIAEKNYSIVWNRKKFAEAQFRPITSEIINHLYRKQPDVSKLAEILYQFKEKQFGAGSEDAKTFFKETFGVELQLTAWRDLLKCSGDGVKEQLKELFNAYFTSKYHADYETRLNKTLNPGEQDLKNILQNHFWSKVENGEEDMLNITQELENLAGPSEHIDIDDINSETGTFLDKEQLKEALKYFKDNPEKVKYVVRDEKSKKLYSVKKLDERHGSLPSLLITYTHHSKDVSKKTLTSSKNKENGGSQVARGGFGKIVLEHKIPEEVICSGNYSVKDRMSYQWFVCKGLFPENKDEDEIIRLVLEEKEIGKTATDKPVYFVHRTSDNQSKKNELHIPIILGKDLFNWIGDKRYLRYNKEVKPYLAAVTVILLQKLRETSEAGIINCDLKLENFMLHIDKNAEIHVKLIDWGLAKYVETITPGYQAGTPFHIAPWLLPNNELGIQSNHIKNLDTELWALGYLIKETLAHAYVTAFWDVNGMPHTEQVIKYTLNESLNLNDQEKALFELSNKLMNYGDNMGQEGNSPAGYTKQDLHDFINMAKQIALIGKPSKTPPTPARLPCADLIFGV